MSSIPVGPGQFPGAFIGTTCTTYINRYTHIYTHPSIHPSIPSIHPPIHPYIHTYITTYIHTCLLLSILMLWHRQAIFESKGDKLSSSAECRIRTQGLRHLFASRLNACWQTDWAIEDQAKNLNSTARPYDQQAFSPLDLTASWLSHLALAIYMFVVGNFDSLAQWPGCQPRGFSPIVAKWHRCVIIGW